jgi:hypothetical protein
MDYLYVPHVDYGKDRRKFIKDWFTAHPDGRYCVNTKYRPQVKEDPDLKKLIRTGFLKQVREHQGRTSARTYLVKNG